MQQVAHYVIEELRDYKYNYNKYTNLLPFSIICFILFYSNGDVLFTLKCL